MKKMVLPATLSFLALLSACSAEQSYNAAPSTEHQAGRNVIDPGIPAVTITARRMTPTEKLAYDRNLPVNVAGLQSSN